MSPASKANQRAVAKYMKNNYDEIKIRVPKGKRSEIQAAAAAVGESVNVYIKKAIDARMGDYTCCEEQYNEDMADPDKEKPMSIDKVEIDEIWKKIKKEPHDPAKVEEQFSAIDATV